MSWSFRRLWSLSAALTSWWPETRLRRLVAERAIGPAHEAHEQLEVPTQAIDQARARDHALFDRSRRRAGLELPITAAAWSAPPTCSRGFADLVTVWSDLIVVAAQTYPGFDLVVNDLGAGLQAALLSALPASGRLESECSERSV
jgi:hypothetical protein